MWIIHIPSFNNNVFFFRAFANERSGSFCNILHTIIIPPQTVFVMCLNLLLGPSAIYSLRHTFLTEWVMSSRSLSWHFHINTLIAILCSAHVGTHVAERDTYGAFVLRDSLLTAKYTATYFLGFQLPTTLPSLGCLRTTGPTIPPQDTNWWTVPAGGGAVTTTQGSIGLTETSGMIRLSQNFSQDGPYTVRYSSSTCFFFHLRQNWRYQRFFHLCASKPAFLTLQRNYPTSGIIKYKFYCQV